MAKMATKRAAPKCPDCGCVCARCNSRGFIPRFINTVDPRLRTRDVLVRAARGGRRAAEVTSPEVARWFGVSIFDASKRLRALERSGCLWRLRRNGRAIVFGVTPYGMDRARAYAAMAK